MLGLAVRVSGTVQGVGFRPFVWRLAHELNLTGWVCNDDLGVLIHVYGSEHLLATFLEKLQSDKPALAVIARISWKNLTCPAPAGFSITGSRSSQQPHTGISPDTAICAACVAEMQDPHNRRYRYAFTHCTHCGPRFSIIKQLPFDRAQTSMAEFALCPECLDEYRNPADRRFHAQANCCPNCGPKCWLEDQQGKKLLSADAIGTAQKLLKQGHILALKGLGGFHLACLATNEQTVQKLRQRKHRYAKPFALMAKDVAVIGKYAQLSALAAELLQSPAAPIVLLPQQGQTLAASVAPQQDHLGFMLPYTPLHALLLAEFDQPLVMTSGNISDEPQVFDNEQARQKLTALADYLLLHNRAIVNRIDDSVLKIMAGQPRLLRRARGYCPQPLKLPAGFESAPGILSMGAELKNTFCLLHHGAAMVSQHNGDLENAEVQQDYRHNLNWYQQLYNFRAQRIAIDSHPGYLSSQHGLALADAQGLPVTYVRHHHAHIAACLAEHGLEINSPPVLGLVFDGLGMGLNNELWGGEFLLADYRSFSRLAHFPAIALPGGSQAMHEPWRNLYAQLSHYFVWPELQLRYGCCDFMRFLADKPLALLQQLISKNLNCPPCSSAGRWFDAFAAVLGLHADQVDYEGQAAMALEKLAATLFHQTDAYAHSFQLDQAHGKLVINWRPLWQAVLEDLLRQESKAVIAARIHHSLIAACCECAVKLSAQTGTTMLVLSGGVFQNRLLLENLSAQLRAQGKTVLSPAQFPSNDGGLALGMALIAAANYEYPS